MKTIQPRYEQEKLTTQEIELQETRIRTLNLTTPILRKRKGKKKKKENKADNPRPQHT